MIEREFISQKIKEFAIRTYIESKLAKVGISQIKIKKIPLGEKIIIYTSRPSLIVGSKGANIRDLTKTLKTDFKLENPQIEINEVKDVFLDAHIVAERIATSLERFGSAQFKGVAHKVMQNVINSGALGIELIISGKIPGARAKSWRFYQGYLKKCGELAITGVRHAQARALLKSGTIGIKVAIMPPNLDIPDAIEILSEPTPVQEPLSEQKEEAKNEKSSKGTDKEKPKRRSPSKKKMSSSEKKENPKKEAS